MNALLLLLHLAASLAHGAVTSEEPVTQKQARVSVSTNSNLRGNSRRLDNSVLCRVTVFGTMFASEDDTAAKEQHDIRCVPIVDGKEIDLDFSIQVSEELLEQHEEEIASGTLMVTLSDSWLDENEKLISGESPEITVMDASDGRYRHLQERHRRMTEFKTLAIIRVSTTDKFPTGSASSKTKIQNAMFGNGINFQTQYDACSFGKLKWSLAEDVFDVQLDGSMASYGNDSARIVTAVQQKVKASRGISGVSDIADKVIMCLPPGTGEWAASAGVNHWRVQSNNEWCTSLSGTMHELGHTMGLLHSNADGIAYNDRSGYMGSGYTNAVWPRKCFNGYHSHHFGWYSDKTDEFNPLQESKQVRLATFVDYNKAASNEIVLVKLFGNYNKEYYLQYNVAKDFNVDTEQKEDLVTITQPGSEGTTSLAGLDVGNSFDVPNFNGSGQRLRIEACRKEPGGSLNAEVMVLSIGMGNSDLCNNPTQSGGRPSVSPRPSSNASSSAFFRWFMEFIAWLRGRR